MPARGRVSTSEGQFHLDLAVPAVPSMVSEVRHAFEKLPLSGDLLDDACLLLSELLTNSIRHAGLRADEKIRILVTVSEARLRVDVLDRTHAMAPREPAGAIRPDPRAESGWGLYLVNRLAARWGWGRDGYWFEMPGLISE